MNAIETRTIALYRSAPPQKQESMWERFIDVIRRRTLGRLVEAEVHELTEKIVADIYYSRQKLDRDVTESARGKMSRWQKISELRKKYKGEADWGNQLVGVITDFNASMQWGQGIRTMAMGDQVRQKGEKPPEQIVWEEFLDFNDLDAEGGLDLGVWGELDGQVLWFWDVDQKEKQVRVWTVPLLETRYQIEYDSRPWEPARAILYPEDPDKKEVLENDKFIFVKLRGIPNGTYGVPTCARVIEEIEDLHKAQRDLRHINHLFASPTPVLTAEDDQARVRLETDLSGINWKIGKILILVGKDRFEFVSIPPDTPKPLIDEITVKVKFVSASTGIPVHFLGFPDLMSNRAVAMEDFQPAMIHAGKAQKRFVGGFEDLRSRILHVYGQLHGRNYDPNAIDCVFPSPQKGVVKELVEAWLPVRLSKQISHKTFLIRIGVEDPDDEIKAVVEEMEQVGVGDVQAEEQADRVQKIVALAQQNFSEAA